MEWHIILIALGQGLVLMAVAPLFVGLIGAVRGRLARGRGPSPLQPYRDLRKLLGVRALVGGNVSPIWRRMPRLIFVVSSALVFLVPVLTTPLLPADMLIMGYILALVRAGLCLAGLDSGAGFAALGSSRELYYYVLTEIGFLLVSTALLFCWRTSAIVELDALHSSYQIYFVWGARECPAACGVATSGSGARIGTRSR